MKKNSLWILAVVSSFIFLSSCLNSNNNTTQPQAGTFLLANASPNSPTLEVFINKSPFDTLQFGQYTPYLANVTPGTYNFLVDSFGVSTATKLNSDVTVEANKAYSFFVIDSFSNLKSAFINDVFQAPSSDSVYVRFFNFCPNSGAISLVESTSGGALSANRTFNDQSTNPQYVAFQEVPAGAYNFQLKNASDSVLKTQSVTLSGGHVYTLFAKGIIGYSGDTTRALSIGQLQNYPSQ